MAGGEEVRFPLALTLDFNQGGDSVGRILVLLRQDMAVDIQGECDS